jgi:hypothetical protein
VAIGVLVNQELALRPEGFLDLLYGGELHGFKERRSGIASAPKEYTITGALLGCVAFLHETKVLRPYS